MSPSATSTSPNPPRNGDSSWSTQYTELLWKHVIVEPKNPHQHRGTFPVLTQMSCCPFHPAQGHQIPFPAWKAMAESRTCTSALPSSAPTGTHLWRKMLWTEISISGLLCLMSCSGIQEPKPSRHLLCSTKGKAPCSRITQQHFGWDDWDGHFQRALLVCTH